MATRAARSKQLQARDANREPIPQGAEGEPVGVVMDITPALAESWLGRNTHNRPLRQRAVDELIAAIKRGEWILNGDSIKFAVDGELWDGQHRLWAIYLSEVTCPSLVVTGLLKHAQETMDTGKRRNLKDTLSLRGYMNASALAAGITYLWKYDNENLRSASIRPTIQQALQLLDQHPGFADSVKESSRIIGKFHGSHGMWSVVHYTLTSLDPEDAGVFFEKLVSGAGLEEGSPILVLRQRLEAEASSAAGARANAVLMHALIIKAWNSWRAGEVIQRLLWKAGGTNPEAFPVPA